MNYSFLKNYRIQKNSYKPTVFEIARFPRREDVFSNLIAFFISNKIEHGFQKIWIDAFSKILGFEIDNIQSVEREVYTETGNRIDLVIYTDSQIIGIENKVDASLYNDLDDYYSYLKNLSEHQQKNPVLAVLSLSNHELKEEYISITYKQLYTGINNVRIEELNKVDQYYLSLFSQTVEAIKRLSGDNEFMFDEDFFHLYNNNKDEVVDIIKRYDSINDYCSILAKDLVNTLNELKLKNVEKLWVWTKVTTVVDFVKIGELKLAIDITHSIDGITVSIFSRKFSNENSKKIHKIIGSEIASYKNNRYYLDEKIDISNYGDKITSVISLIQSIDMRL